ncbi:Pentatricopeptide repeat-containing protein [Abeliophyllum distichum]|uniref:Pentatricopeptide repeat-containing protein n=1 Tax=Abeliophyllum distichum TaxID=126358 RepID=A0ABD1QVR0_9LAMI
MLAKGEIVAERLLKLEPLNVENYILLSSMYASRSDWVKMSHVRKQMKDRGIKQFSVMWVMKKNGMPERLAIACALLKTKALEEIRIVKNLRVCGDCHEVKK